MERVIDRQAQVEQDVETAIVENNTNVADSEAIPAFYQELVARLRSP